MMILRVLVFLFFLTGTCLAQSNQINIQAFKVNGTDKKDDTQLFDKAIEYIAAKGGILYIPEGNYILDQRYRSRVGVNNTSYIFLVKKDATIKMHPRARLIYKNGFKGFRFRTATDPNSNTVAKLNFSIQGGIVDAALNNNYKQLNNPNIWAFVGEYFKSFKVQDLRIENLQGTAGIASYNNRNFSATKNTLINVSGNHHDYIDNHGDGIYVSNTSTYEILNNTIQHTVGSSNKVGRIGICIEYEESRNGQIMANNIRGYDRGIHIELIKGTAVISNNILEGNLSGIVLWNNYKFKQIVKNNSISNSGLDKGVKPILYTHSPILLLEYNSNSGTEILNNTIIMHDEYYLPHDMMQITSSDIKILGNTFLDYSKSLSFSVSQGKSANERVQNIQFKDNKVTAKRFMAYDGSILDIQNNDLDVEEAVLSFDNSSNIYRGNVINRASERKAKVSLYGKYN